MLFLFKFTELESELSTIKRLNLNIAPHPQIVIFLTADPIAPRVYGTPKWHLIGFSDISNSIFDISNSIRDIKNSIYDISKWVQFFISIIRISDISNSNFWYLQFNFSYL